MRELFAAAQKLCPNAPVAERILMSHFLTALLIGD